MPAANKLSSLWPESPGSGDLQISRTLPISSLQEGVNTLVVAVVDGRGRKVERAVSFIVSAPLVTEREDVEVVLPDRLRPDVRLFGVIRMSEPHVVGRPQAPEGKLLAPPRAQRRQVLERSVARLVPELSANRTKTATSKATDTVNTATQKVPPKHS